MTQIAPLDLPTPAPDDHGVIDLEPVITAARAAAGCPDEVDYPMAVFETWYRLREATATRLLCGWHCVTPDHDGRLRAAVGEVVTFAASPRHNCQARLTPMPRGFYLVDAQVSSERMQTDRGLGASVLDSRAYADRRAALRHAVDVCLGHFQAGHEARYTRIIAQIKAAAEAAA